MPVGVAPLLLGFRPIAPPLHAAAENTKERTGVFRVVIKFFNNPEKLENLIRLLMQGVGVTGKIFFLTLIFSVPLGLIVALGRRSKRWYINKPISFYIYIMRSTPLMLQLIFIYYLMPKILPFKLDRFVTVIFSYVINYAAYFAEIFRGGIEAVPVGQREAAHVLGMNRFQTFWRIIMPQAAKHSLLPCTNEIITLVKDTALASCVAVVDLMTMAKKQVTSSSSVEPYLVAIIFYLILNGIVEQVCKWVERRMNYYR